MGDNKGFVYAFFIVLFLFGGFIGYSISLWANSFDHIYANPIVGVLISTPLIFFYTCYIILKIEKPIISVGLFISVLIPAFMVYDLVKEPFAPHHEFNLWFQFVISFLTINVFLIAILAAGDA